MTVGSLSASLAGTMPCKFPSRSRRTRNCGWNTSRMLHPWRNTSMVTESTRKGRSSVTICTTVAPPAVQPSSFWLGVRMLDHGPRAAGRCIAAR